MIAMLALSMGGSSVCAGRSQSVEHLAQSAATPARVACCCGTSDASCCGTSCCIQQRSNQAPTAPPLRSDNSDSDSQIVGLIASADAQSSLPGASGARAAADSSGWLKTSSLQTRHVRIQT
jgi:hypothetical protein